jgi:hypothetical protein
MKRRPEFNHGAGIRGLDRHAWVSLARRAVTDLVEARLAVPRVELEARLWDRQWEEPETGRRASFFPHILNEAIRDLVTDGELQTYHHPTKGGTVVEVYIPGNLEGRLTAVMQAVRRSSMLYARFHRWSQVEFGPAGETVVRDSLTDAMPHGYLPITPGFGEVPRLGTAKVNGALDSGAWMLLKDPATHLPELHAVLIEIKNRRATFYPRHDEIHQLLSKSAHLQKQLPTQPIVPVFVCRRAHPWLFWMAKDLGFFVWETKRQFMTMPDKTDPRLLDEVKTELALDDLTIVSAGSRPRIIHPLTESLPRMARESARRWAAVGAQLLDDYKTLRNERLKPWDRTAALSELRTNAEIALNDAGIPSEAAILQWALEGEEETF